MAMSLVLPCTGELTTTVFTYMVIYSSQYMRILMALLKQLSNTEKDLVMIQHSRRSYEFNQGSRTRIRHFYKGQEQHNDNPYNGAFQ